MKKNKVTFKKIFATTLVLILMITLFTTVTIAEQNTKQEKGFDKGPSYKSVIPTKQTTFIGYDENSYLDDYAYLSSLSTAVFKNENTLYSHPLLFYKDQQNYEGNKVTLNDRQGIDYFMEDWQSYCNDRFDEITTINVAKSEVNHWKSKNYNIIEGNNPFTLAKKIALKDWSYSDDAVVSVIDTNFEKNNNRLNNKISKTLETCEVKKERTLSLKQSNSLNPVSQEFTVEDEYVYIEADCWWDGILIANKMIPTGDPDLQLYCKHGDDWMQTVASAAWNIYKPAGHEISSAYVYNPGEWRVAVTDFPTEGEAPPRKGIQNIFQVQGSIGGMLKNMLSGVQYKVDITKYPGMHFDIPDLPDFGTSDAYFNLSWNNENVNLGFTLIGPSGEAIYTAAEENEESIQKMHIDHLGEIPSGEKGYKFCVFSKDDVTTPVDFEIEYSWGQNITREQSDSLTSATEGAILASQLNAPLLYTKNNKLSEETKDVLYKLGVKNIHLIDLNSRVKNEVKNQLDDIADVKHYSDYKYIYDEIRLLSGSIQDIVFSTLDPWTKWYKEELKPGDETEAALFIGPAAYSAAHHGTPVIFVENHPELSQAVTYHNDFWRKHAGERYDFKPSMGEMILTGTQIYDFLDDYDFDKIGDESIVTIADQYDIGMSWDRIFPGVANSGRICGSPVDTATWISRSMFYPCLIFQNPALQGKVELINGSKSSQDVGLGNDALIDINLGTFKIDREAGLETYEHPALCSFVKHQYRFNERASKYYGAKYQCADGFIPGETTTMNPIDQGTMEKYTGKEGMIFPDISETEMVPFYLKRGGYDVAFSTKLESVVENLNKGVLLWVHSSHGSEPNGGQTLFWDPEVGFDSHSGVLLSLINILRKISSIPLVGPIISNLFFAGFVIPGALQEENPWRGYDWQMGSTLEPDTMSMDMKGFIPFTNIRLPLPLATGMTWVLARKPVREFLNSIIPIANPFNVDNLYDGVTGAIGQSKYPLVNKNSSQIEENLENLHSLGFITSICQTSNTYLHMMMIRHGSVFQVQDPWPTSWYAAVWRQSIPRDIILGKTVGEAYSKGIGHVGPLYLSEQWWWDDAENVVYFGDPDLRMFVPNTEYSDKNYWTEEDVKPMMYDSELNIDGHMPYGADNYPHEREPKTWFEQYLPIILIILLIIVILIGMIFTGKHKRGDK